MTPEEAWEGKMDGTWAPTEGETLYANAVPMSDFDLWRRRFEGYLWHADGINAERIDRDIIAMLTEDETVPMAKDETIMRREEAMKMRWPLFVLEIAEGKYFRLNRLNQAIPGLRPAWPYSYD